MLKVFLPVIVLYISGCSSQPKPLPAPPAALPGGWKLAAPGSPVSPPPLVTQYGVKRSFAAIYNGPCALKVTFYEMPGESSSFELTQKWRPAAGMLFFHQGPWFVTVESDGVAYAMLSPVVRALQDTLQAK